MKVIYQGLFLDDTSNAVIVRAEGAEQLEVNTPHKHVTFELNPKEFFPEELLGKDFPLIVTGYGNDGINAGFEVELPNELLPFYKGAKTVHITTSLSSEARAKDTANLSFETIYPFQVVARLGYFIGKGVLFETPCVETVKMK